jgi:hypothetical protein
MVPEDLIAFITHIITSIIPHIGIILGKPAHRPVIGCMRMEHICIDVIRKNLSVREFIQWGGEKPPLIFSTASMNDVKERDYSNIQKEKGRTNTNERVTSHRWQSYHSK